VYVKPGQKCNESEERLKVPPGPDRRTAPGSHIINSGQTSNAAAEAA